MEFLGKKNNISKWLWENPHSLNKTEQTLKAVLQIFIAIFNDIKQGQLSLRAMSLVYTTIISLVPLFAISFSVLKGLGAHNQIRPFLINTLDALGEKKFEIADKIIGFVDNIQVGVLGSLGVAILIYTVIGMLQKIEKSFNYVWSVSKPRSFAKRINDYLSVLFIAPILVLLSTAITTSSRTSYITDKLHGIYAVDILFTLVGVLLPYIILALAFTFLYSFVPNTKVKFKAAFISGLVTAFIWKSMGWGFSNFVANSANHTAVYSAFATIIVFMIWVYLVWLILLIGANIGFYIQYPQRRKIGHNIIDISGQNKEALAINIMAEIAKSFESKLPSLNTDTLSHNLNQPQNIIDLVCTQLKEASILTNEENTQAWIPAYSPNKINLYDVISAIRKHSHDNETTPTGKEAQKYIKETDSLFAKNFKDKTIIDLI